MLTMFHAPDEPIDLTHRVLDLQCAVPKAKCNSIRRASHALDQRANRGLVHRAGDEVTWLNGQERPGPRLRPDAD